MKEQTKEEEKKKKGQKEKDNRSKESGRRVENIGQRRRSKEVGTRVFS